MKTYIRANQVPGLSTVIRAAAMTVLLLLAGCSGGENSSSANSTVTWPSAPPPATSQTNTYIGTQSPGWYTVTIDHIQNTYSYQDLSTGAAAVSGTFTTTSGVLVLSKGGFALEQLSRALLLAPSPGTSGGQTTFISNAIFAISAPTCQVIPGKAQFDYIGMASPYYGAPGQEEALINAGLIGTSSDTTGANWQFGGELQYLLSNPGTPFAPTPDPFSATCSASNAAPSVIQTAITVPASIPTNLAIGPTGLFVEDRYASSFTANYGVSFIGAVKPAFPIDLSQLTGATFRGVEVVAGEATANTPAVSAPQLLSVSSALDKAGNSIELTGAAFLSNDPTQPLATSGIAIDLGVQDSVNYGYFPLATFTYIGPNSTGTPVSAYALVTQAGGKYSIFVTAVTGAGVATGVTLFQQ